MALEKRRDVWDISGILEFVWNATGMCLQYWNGLQHSVTDRYILVPSLMGIDIVKSWPGLS